MDFAVAKNGETKDTCVDDGSELCVAKTYKGSEDSVSPILFLEE